MTEALRSKGDATLGHETNLARAPMWAARASAKPVQLALLSGPLVMHGVDFRQVEGPQLTVGDQRVVAELTTRFLRDACPEHRRIPITLTEVARALGFEAGADGGKGRGDAKRSLARIRSVTFSSSLAPDDRFPRIWGLVDNADPISPRGGRPARIREAGYVTLNKYLAQLLREGHVTFLHYPTWDAISREDAVAGRLWCYLEAERITAGWNYSLFAGPTDGCQDQRYMPAIADLLLLDWPVRRQIAARIKKACAVVGRIDPRYDLAVLRSRTAGMWHLRVHRSNAQRRAPDGLPPAVREGWRRAYGPRRPSAKQWAVLDEIAARRTPEWVSQLLDSNPGGDLLAHAMYEDRRLSAEALAAADAAEQTWREAKARESATAPESLAGILASLAERGLLRSSPESGSDMNPDEGGGPDDLETGTFSDADHR